MKHHRRAEPVIKDLFKERISVSLFAGCGGACGNPKPFIVEVNHTGPRAPHSIDKPLTTVTSPQVEIVCCDFAVSFAVAEQKRASSRGAQGELFGGGA